MNNFKFKVAALDTNIFIYYFEDNLLFAEKSEAIFDALAQGRLRAATSIITLSEILSASRFDKTAVKETRKQFLQVPNLEIYSVDEAIALKSAEIRRKYGFKLFDSIQLATALVSKAKVFITNDDRLKSFKEIKVVNLKDF